MSNAEGGTGMRRAAAVFEGHGERFVADSCEPLKAAAERGEVALQALSRGSYPGRRLLPGELPELRSAGVWDASRDQGWGLDWHRNEGIEITYLARGGLGFAVDGRPQPLRPGDLTITRPWQAHRVGDPEVAASRLHWVILDVGVRRPHQTWAWPSWLLLPSGLLTRLTTLLQQNEQPVWRADAAIDRCFERLASVLADDPGDAREARLKLRINELLLAVFELLDGQDIALDRSLPSAQRSVELFLATLADRCGERWRLRDMAEECGLGRSRFTHYCRQLTNMTPVEVLTHLRVRAAQRMLENDPAGSVSDVAYACGFESSQYFATVFRRHTGRSPSAYRAERAERARERAPARAA
ncbi:MAG: AraC family transcriptional regulator [Trueperaceae bacterium]|nr:AraC family transcriptional regulator [Trueperaceae bacterium]